METGALDLGSTSIKGARLAADGGLDGAPAARPAPPLSGEGGIREGDPTTYARAAEEVLAALALPPGAALGLAVQRSTFLVWDADGTPRTPMISWQDRRAADWCARHAGDRPDLERTTGLLLSAHYAGPKLAALLERSAELRDLLAGGGRIGTLDAWLVWRATDGRRHVTDPTMAARTLLYDLQRRDWSDPLLDWYGIPRAALPEIRPTCGRDEALDAGPRLRAAVSDQGAAVLGLLPDDPAVTLVSLGTGAFVLHPAAADEPAPAGYLRAPVLAPPDGPWRFVLEGTVNGAGAALDRFPRTDAPLPERDPTPEAFAIPDVSGLGAPHWRPDVGLELSEAAAALDDAGRRRAVTEGLLFRIRQLLDDLCPGTERLLLSGGLSADPALAPGLAAVTGKPVEVLAEREAGLLGAGRLAAGLPPRSAAERTRVEPGPAGAYLPAKFARWRTWLERRLAHGAGPLDAP